MAGLQGYKSQLKSSTIQSIAVAGALLGTPNIYDLVRDHWADLPPISGELRTGLLSFGAVALNKAREGRIKATSRIGKPEEPEIVSWTSLPQPRPEPAPDEFVETDFVDGVPASLVQELAAIESLAEPEPGGIGEIVATQGTWLKAEAVDSGLLADEDRFSFSAGDSFRVLWIGDDIIKGHRQVDLTRPLKGRHKWYLYIEHWDVKEALHPQLRELDLPQKPEYTGKVIMLPGLGERRLDQPIDGCENFTWGEATHGGTRIPRHGDIYPGLTPEKVTQNLILSAQNLEKVRADYGGKPIRINSWYRPPSVNRSVGGSTQSRHMYGDAVDFVIFGVSTYDVYNRYDASFIGGLASSSVFTHMDLRGYRARWSYGY